MDKVLVMGITGSFGGHVAKELIKQDYKVKALMRDPQKLPDEFTGVEVFQGTAASIDDVRNAAEGVDVIVYGINPPNYDWKGKAVEWLEIAASVAEEKQLTIVFPGNVYVFNPKDGPLFTEQSPQRPVTEKGRLRVAMEKRLQQAADNGAKIIIVRAGDFIAANSKSSWIQHIIKPVKGGYQIVAPGSADLKHTWGYLPDLAKVTGRLIAQRQQLDVFNVFHFKGYRASVRDIANTIQQITGEEVIFKSFPWIILKLLSPFSKLFYGLVEMSYLWKQEVSLDDTKLKQFLGKSLYETEFSKAIISTGLLKISSSNEMNMDTGKVR